MEKNMTISQNITILFDGRWTAQNIEVNEIQSTRLVDRNLESALSVSWNNTVDAARKEGKKVWDSDVYRFEHLELSMEKLYLYFSIIPFSVRLEMNKYTEKIRQLGQSYGAKGLFSSCLVKTVDGYFVFVLKSDTYLTQKKYAWVGGVLSKSEEIIRSGSDLFRSAEREVFEELGVKKEHITETTLRVGYLTENWNVCLLFFVQLSLTKNELQKQFESFSDDEAKDLVFINENDNNDSLSIFEEKDRIKFVLMGVFC